MELLNSIKVIKLIGELDIACGKLIVAAMKDPLVKEAMEDVSLVSFKLRELIEEEE